MNLLDYFWGKAQEEDEDLQRPSQSPEALEFLSGYDLDVDSDVGSLLSVMEAQNQRRCELMYSADRALEEAALVQVLAAIELEDTEGSSASAEANTAVQDTPD